ncbi:hypothetical protein TcasGA2_TC002744 [Tribolium castaneum]|uniref:Uncharacterized protein n=1 Tax=Tribolium castaneum TaxID=7070 RepID=D6WDM7_TRICA|nr:hypothetical protein TcasGA2_TC002744 [Tribolium castaneum]
MSSARILAGSQRKNKNRYRNLVPPEILIEEEAAAGEFLWVACVGCPRGRLERGEGSRSMQERAGNTSPPRWWKQTEQYLCELMRTENNLFEQNEKCKKHIEAPLRFYHARLHSAARLLNDSKGRMDENSVFDD